METAHAQLNWYPMFKVVFFYFILFSVILTLTVVKSVFKLQRFMLSFTFFFVGNIYNKYCNFFLLKALFISTVKYYV
jgi:hypothetical protein